MRALALAALATIAGCLDAATVAPEDAPDVATLLARPWYDNWVVRSQSYEIDYDPEARHVAAEGTLEVANELGHDRPYLLLLMEPYTVTRLEDEAHGALEYAVEGPNDLVRMLPEPAREPAFHFQALNVTLKGDVSHGAVHRLRIAFEGWSDYDAPPFGAGVDVPVGAPNDFAQNLHFALVPIVSDTPTTETRLTIRAPADWTVLPSAMPVSTSTDGERVTTEYAIRSAFVAIMSAKGLESLQDDVDGIEVRTFFWPDMRPQGRVAHEVSKRVLRVMPQYTGPYPYDHIWTVPHPVAVNAFSTPGLTFMGLNFYRFHLQDVPVQFGRTFAPMVGGQDGFEGVIVHEHVHNWWGHNVGGNVSTPEVRTGWVTEGFTTYLSELVWFDTQYGRADAATSGRDKALAMMLVEGDLTQGPSGSARPGGSQYTGTAVGLRALEAYAIATARPNATFEALKLVQQRYGGVTGGSGIGVEEDVFAAFEEVFGEDLDRIWEMYISDGKLPDLAIGAVARDGGNLTLEVRGAALMGAEVRAVTAAGRELWGWTVVVDGAGQLDLAIPAGVLDPVVRIEVDPHHFVYEANEANNVWVGAA